ncbi:MAG: hypothetical protein Q9221_007744 [Calogaya cf. arnoldii]
MALDPPKAKKDEYWSMIDARLISRAERFIDARARIWISKRAKSGISGESAVVKEILKASAMVHKTNATTKNSDRNNRD